MHVAIVLVELGGVGLGGESGEAFLVDVDAQWLVRGHHNVDSQVKLVTVNEEWIGDVARND